MREFLTEAGLDLRIGPATREEARQEIEGNGYYSPVESIADGLPDDGPG